LAPDFFLGAGGMPPLLLLPVVWLLPPNRVAAVFFPAPGRPDNPAPMRPPLVLSSTPEMG
jgi:hypothetical protein